MFKGICTRLLSLVLAIVLCISCLSGCSENKASKSCPLTVGIFQDAQWDNEWTPYFTDTQLSKDLFKLLTGYETISLSKDLSYVTNNTAIKEAVCTKGSDGSDTWTFKLNTGLLWSNGEKITAQDYVLTLLLWTSPQALTLGAQNITYGEKLMGYKEYSQGASQYFSGVRLLDSDSFSLTISPESLPYYYEATYVRIIPTYSKALLPSGIEIKDSEKGCCFSKSLEASDIEASLNEYRNRPSVFSGPYVIKSFDEATQTLVLDKNKYFKGNYEGEIPEFSSITLQKAVSESYPNDTCFDLIPNITDSETLAGFEDKIKNPCKCTYYRNGYSLFSFVDTNGPTQFQEVRQAIAYLIDYDDLCSKYFGGNAVKTEGAFSTCLPEYKSEKASLDTALTSYSYSPEDAVAVLEKGGWIYDSEGKQYSGEGLRYKKVSKDQLGNSQCDKVILKDGTILMALKINTANAEGGMTYCAQTFLKDYIAENENIGMDINIITLTFYEMYNDHMLNPNETLFNMYAVATDFKGSIYDVTSDFSEGECRSIINISNSDLKRLALEMVKLSPNDKDKHLEKWLSYQTLFSQQLPYIPLFSSQRTDLYSMEITSYNTDDIWDWTNAIYYCSKTNKK